MQSAPAPVIEQKTEVVMMCPAELAPVPDRPDVPGGAVLHGNATGMKWLGDVLTWASNLMARFEDARAACP